MNNTKDCCGGQSGHSEGEKKDCCEASDGATAKAHNDCCGSANHGGAGKFNLYQVGKWGAIAIIVYYLLAEHRAHVFAFLPYLFLLACPLMHMFMHGGHGHHGHNHTQGKEQKNESRG